MAGAISQDVIEKIIQQAAEEAALICSFTRDIDWLKNELRIISGGLNYANSLLAQDDDVKDWLRHARDVAWDAEDIVEEFVVYNRDELFSRDKMAKKIQEVKERSRFITKYGKQLKLFRDLVPSPSEKPSSSPAWKENSLLLRDSHPVAIEPKLQHLISLLDESTVPVIAVVGIGGTGKTFLLQNLFDRIKQRYEHSIWLSMSQSYSVHKLQCDLASHMGYLKDAVKDASEKRAAELIHADLQKTKSLIVLDDVWRATREDNVIRSLGLPIGHDSQCKIVVTTRNRGVGQNLEACIYEMELLSEDESWQLFCAYAFSNYNGDLPPHHLKAVAHEVEKQCGRLPLALKTIAASLSGCTEPSEWNSKLSRLKELEVHRQKEVTTPDYRIIEILRLSYDSLPAALKPCFSYLSFFPEVERIDCEYLINLWIVEGFVPQGEDQWDVAWGYLYQLANLCLLEVWEDWGLIKYCKIHDLLYDLAIEMSKENRCSFAVEDVTSVKRILLAKQEIDDMVMEHSRVSCPRSLRTLLLYKNLIERIEINFFSPMRLLRVLDLSESNISTLPDFVGKLKLLRLLNLSSTKIKEIPICVRSLKSLVFLDLCHCQQLQTLPEWINDLRCLQHLNIKNCNDELRSHMPKGISELVSLRVLRSDPLSLSVEEDGLLKLGDVIKLNRLQELSLEVTHEKELKIIEDGILAQLLRMRYLSIESHFSIESHLPHNITALQDLQTLCLGKFAVPSWVWMLTNLRQLTLFNCDCIDYPALETMPNLIELRLEGNKSCRKVPKAFGKSSGFPKLRFLIISDFPLLEELPDLEDGAMAVLEKFHLVRCPRVKKVPEGLKGLRGLLDFYCGMKGTDAHLSQPSQKEDIAVLSNFSSPPQPSQQQTIAGSSTTMETDFMSLLKKFDGISQANDLIQYIEELLKNMSGEKSEITPRSPYIKDGQAFMEIIEKHIAGLDKTDLMNSVTAEIENEVMEVLKGVGKIQCVGAALSMVGFALEISRQMSKSYQECFELLKDMFDLGKHILCLNEQMAEHKQMLNESLQCIVMGCIMCVSQSRTNIFRYLTASVNAESLQDFRHKINLLYADLKLLRIIEIESRETKIPPPSQEFHTFVEYKHRSDEVSVPREKHRIFLICYESDCIRTMVDKLFKSLNAGGVTVIVIELLQWEMAGKKDLSLKQVSEGTDIHFPIFSKENYLRLLEQWLCICRPNSIIRPLFYDTNEDIKCQFDKTLNKLAYKQDSTAGVFSSSSNAPLQMSFLPGWSSLDYRTEWRLVKRVVFDVLEMLNNLPLPLPLHAVGLEERMEDLIGKLKMESDTKNMVVAISGVGGIGKTTLAKAIFDSIGPKFQARSLVGPVKAKELCKLQEHILKDLSRQDILVKSIEHGKALMKAHLGSIRALVILDDIDHSMQLEAFNVDCLAPGSRLIITSRDTELLAFAHADKIYDMAQLGFEQSVELFSWHAFLRTDPDDGYEDRSKKIAKSCQGIPLLLEVAGASLYDRTETSHWDESIRNLESTIDQNIHRRLCVSAQGLESRELKCF
ncbi:disease resistance protein RPM1 [Cryptomeria japonica]|uniref:disease resistance protein RPM1 n=1 Tax=Cryptomeria japonica TaxID=3369 RepID=UPI0027DA1FCF|nr:disease resistance protein RPM1 [Cryptomeria japonica]